ncbi:hypothetical protein MKEN_01304900 [Mycena kentingensis (nom. inval.)]|nr:hypothetical protein MKEN_01304900 [Mycena kentingensis (nom. inval.)]
MPHSTADQAFIDALPYSALQDFRDRSFLSTHVHDRAQHFVVDHSWVDIGQLRAFTTKRAIASAVISRASFDASGVDGLPVGFISRYRDTIYRADYIAEFPERFLSTDWIDASHIRKILENTRHFDAPADPLADIQVRDVRDERGRIVPRATSGSPPKILPTNYQHMRGFTMHNLNTFGKNGDVPEQPESPPDPVFDAHRDALVNSPKHAADLDEARARTAAFHRKQQAEYAAFLAAEATATRAPAARRARSVSIEDVMDEEDIAARARPSLPSDSRYILEESGYIHPPPPPPPPPAPSSPLPPSSPPPPSSDDIYANRRVTIEDVEDEHKLDSEGEVLSSEYEHVLETIDVIRAPVDHRSPAAFNQYTDWREADTKWGIPGFKSFTRDAAFNVTTQKSVSRVEYLFELPPYLPIPAEDTAFIVDLDRPQFDFLDGKNTLRTIDALIKNHDNDSWKGTTGTGDSTVWVKFGPNDDPILCYRSHWWDHKAMSAWILPCLVRSLSPMSDIDWDSTPSTTNTGESQHHWTNTQTGTKLSLVEAIETARIVDFRVVDDIRLALNSGVLVNPYNHAAHRATKNMARHASTARKYAEGRAQASAAQALDQEIAEAKRLQKEAAGRVKELNAQKSAGKSKGKGRPARVLAGDSSSGRVRSTAARSAALAAPPNTDPFPSMALREQAVPDHAAPILFPLSIPTDESFPDPASFATDDAALDFGFPSSDDFGLNDASFWSDDILAGLGDAMYNEFTAVTADNFGAVSYPSQGNTGIYLPGLQAPLPPQENLGMYFPGSQLPPPRPSPSPPPMPLASTSYMAGNDADTASAAATRAPTRRSSRKRARAESAPGSVAQKRARQGAGLTLDWEVEDENEPGRRISARDLAKKYPEEWARHYANKYGHLL